MLIIMILKLILFMPVKSLIKPHQHPILPNVRGTPMLKGGDIMLVGKFELSPKRRQIWACLKFRMHF